MRTNFICDFNILRAGCYDFSVMDIISYGQKDLMLIKML